MSNPAWFDGMGFELGQRVTGESNLPQPNQTHEFEACLGRAFDKATGPCKTCYLHACPYNATSTHKTPSQKRRDWVGVLIAWALLAGFFWLACQTDPDLRQSGKTYWQDRGGK